MKRIIIFMIFLMLLMYNAYCNEKQGEKSVYTQNLYAQNEVELNKDEVNLQTNKDTASVVPLLKRQKNCMVFALDAVVLPGINVGYGWVKYDSTYTSEEVINLHVNYLDILSTIGIYFQKNRFERANRTGFFGFWKFGIDYAKDRMISIFAEPCSGGSKYKHKEFLFPLITAGFGYSWKVDNSSFFRITGDIGMKIFIADLTLSYVFGN